MNIVWIIIVCVGLIILIITNPNIAFSCLLTGSENAISLSLKLWAIYAVWLGLLKIMENVGLDKKIAKLLNKPINFLFGKVPDDAKTQISINLSCNMLGMGNASVPSGIKAMQFMQGKTKFATNAMIMLMLLNTCNLQLFPATIIGMRIFEGSKNASVIIIPTLLVSIVCVFVSVLLVKIFGKLFKDKE